MFIKNKQFLCLVLPSSRQFPPDRSSSWLHTISSTGHITGSISSDFGPHSIPKVQLCVSGKSHPLCKQSQASRLLNCSSQTRIYTITFSVGKPLSKLVWTAGKSLHSPEHRRGCSPCTCIHASIVCSFHWQKKSFISGLCCTNLVQAFSKGRLGASQFPWACSWSQESWCQQAQTYLHWNWGNQLGQWQQHTVVLGIWDKLYRSA